MKHFMSIVFFLFIGDIVIQEISAFVDEKVIKPTFRGKKPKSSKLTAGRKLGSYDLPYLVYLSLEREVGKRDFWGVGALIHREWILTARHLLLEFNKPYTKVKKVFNMWALPAYYSDLNLLKSLVTKLPILGLYCHPWDKSKSYLVEDLALIKVKAVNTDMSKGEYSIPVNLPDQNFDVWGQQIVSVAGWGSSIPGVKNQTTFLQTWKLEIQKKEVCRKLYSDFTTNEWFCAGDSAHTTCNGDAGAPAIIGYNNTADVATDHTILGVASFNDFNCTRAGGFINVAHFRGWIDEVINNSPDKYKCANLVDS
ncbi:granzyme G-like [Brevipalpus obovatus]|uniref:granzyme G-like n=1 Tax=Brevipalpus obovatus TaxID=246614 RepID=UPI003D9F03C7